MGYGRIPRWLAAVSGLVSVGLLVGGAFMASPNLNVIPELLRLVWLLVASTALVIRPGDPGLALNHDKITESRTLEGATN